MKVVILCGGQGIRLKEDAEFRPKPMVPIHDRPILYHIMKIYSHYGFNDFILCLGLKGDMITNYFLNYRELTSNFSLGLRAQTKRSISNRDEDIEDWNITFIDTGVDTMTGSRIAQVEPFIGDDDEFFLAYGDTLANINIRELYAFHKAMGRIVTLTGAHPMTPLGIVEAEDGLVKTFKEKTRMEGMVKGGFYVCNRRVFKYLWTDKNCVFENEPLLTLVQEKEVALFDHTDFWYLVDTHKQLRELEEMWLSGTAPWKVWE